VSYRWIQILKSSALSFSHESSLSSSRTVSSGSAGIESRVRSSPQGTLGDYRDEMKLHDNESDSSDSCIQPIRLLSREE